jgi:hypothetical protein
MVLGAERDKHALLAVISLLRSGSLNLALRTSYPYVQSGSARAPLETCWGLKPLYRLTLSEQPCGLWPHCFEIKMIYPWLASDDALLIKSFYP